MEEYVTANDTKRDEILTEVQLDINNIFNILSDLIKYYSD